jgi:hypothetical protein
MEQISLTQFRPLICTAPHRLHRDYWIIQANAMTDIERQLSAKLSAEIEFKIPQTSGAPIWPKDELGFGIPMEHSITSVGAFLAI